MFKGIIEGLGRIQKLETVSKGLKIWIHSPFPLSALKKGDSIAVNGCCLTLISKLQKSFAAPRRDCFAADVSPETLKVTNLKSLSVGSAVNLERSLRLADRIDGHIVQGHVDEAGTISGIRKQSDSYEIDIQFPKKLRPYFIIKGSVAVDGISMTIHRIIKNKFTLVVVPHTWNVTNLKEKKVGDSVNLEVDMVGKYIESFAQWNPKKTNQNSK